MTGLRRRARASLRCRGIGFPAAFGYCRICGRTAADYEVLHTVFVDGRPPTDLEAVFEGGREGFVNCEEIICIDCLPDDGSYP